jgi:hypothetical protein
MSTILAGVGRNKRLLNGIGVDLAPDTLIQVLSRRNE